MEWLDRLNKALGYIEENLESEIEYDKLAKIACCSTYHFQRMFSYIGGIPLSEYIRNRRLTRAAFDLQNGDKVIDVSMRYGYKSPTSFNRAFKNFHDISPSEAQKEGVILKSHPPISFKITVKGVEQMEYKIVNQKEIRVVGISIPLAKNIEKNFQEVPMFWGKVASSGQINTLVSLMQEDSKGLLGISACGEAEENWKYYIAVKTDKQVPEGFEEYVIPAYTWAIFPGKGKMPEAIQDIEKKIITEWLPTSGYEYDNGPDIELYINQDPVNSKFEVWIPVKKA